MMFLFLKVLVSLRDVRTIQIIKKTFNGSSEKALKVSDFLLKEEKSLIQL